jgi:hypothetical protein
MIDYDLTNIKHRISLLEELGSASNVTGADQAMYVAADGSIIMGPAVTEAKSSSSTITADVAVVDIETVASTTKTAFVVNQAGDAPVADFQADGVSIVNIADSGKVSVIGEMLVDGRIMVCAGGACSPALDAAVDETMGDIGVEGTVVAGAFEGYCAEGYVWVPGSAKYGTMPGFCVQSDEAKLDFAPAGSVWTDISQGEAQYTCQTQGDGYHLLSENEWLTIAENIMRTNANDLDPYKAGIQLASTTLPTVASTTELAISTGAKLTNFAGGTAEWTDQTALANGCPTAVNAADWNEYYDVTDYKGLAIAPAYYYSNIDNGIGRIKTGADNIDNLRGFVRGTAAIYDLDLSNAPTTATGTIGFRCAK